MSHEMERGDAIEQTEEITAARPNLVLIGFMAVGKSKIGPMCARRLGYEFWDSDIEIERQTGCSVAELFAREGESAFRERERQVVAELAARRGAVISTGGGTVLNPENAARLRETGLVVLLTAPAHVILYRLGDTRKRPLLANAPNPLARIQDLLSQRTPCYERTAHYAVSTVKRTPGKIVTEILTFFDAALQGKQE